MNVLDKALDVYDFGDNVVITNIGKWQKESDHHHLTVLSADIQEGATLVAEKITFHVKLDSVGNVIESYGYVSNGSEI